jgi:hypothetical protein
VPHTRSGATNGDETTSIHQDVGLPSRSTLSKTSQIAGILRKKRIGVKKVQNFVFGSRFFVLPEDAVVRVNRAARASNNRSFQTVQISPLPFQFSSDGFGYYRSGVNTQWSFCSNPGCHEMVSRQNANSIMQSRSSRCPRLGLLSFFAGDSFIRQFN